MYRFRFVAADNFAIPSGFLAFIHISDIRPYSPEAPYIHQSAKTTGFGRSFIRT